MRVLTKQHAVALARAEHDQGVEAIKRVRALTGELRQALAQVRAPEPNLLAITTALGQAIDGRNVWTDARVADIERALDAAEHLLPARLPDLTPYVGETPRLSLTADGGWLAPENEPRSGWHPQQPEPIEPPV